MNVSVNERIAEWATRQVADGADCFKLEQLDASEDDNILDSWPVTKSLFSNGPGQFSVDVLETAKAAVESAGRRLRFIIRALREGERVASMPLPAIDPTMSSAVMAYEGSVGVSPTRVPGNPVIDAMVQSQTHSERMHRIAVAASAEALAALVEDNKFLRMRCRRLERDRDETAAARESMLSQAHERKLATERQANHEKRKDEVVSKILMMAPLIMAKLSGKPDKKGAEKMVIDSFKESLSEDQVGQLLQVFTVPQRMLIEQLLGLGTPTADLEEEKKKTAEKEKSEKTEKTEKTDKKG